jgi:hypothetical protein
MIGIIVSYISASPRAAEKECAVRLCGKFAKICGITK